VRARYPRRVPAARAVSLADPFPMPHDPFNDPPEPDRAATRHGESPVDIRTESESRLGWSYQVGLRAADGSWSEYTVTLAWCDHDYWSGGRQSPSVVLRRALEAALDGGAGPRLPQRFDAARLRRLVPDLDDQMRPGSAAA
jgi:hypothetical protein